LSFNFVDFPAVNLEYLRCLTDTTGVVQHSKFATPNRKEGYATDDNARALIFCAKHYDVFESSEIAKLADVYLSFLYHMQRNDGRLHNFLGYDRRFLDEVGSDDCLGRTLWACGHVINSSFCKEKKLVAKEIFDKAVSYSVTSIFPRTKAFAILGLCEYHHAYPNDQNVLRIIVELVEDLVSRYKANSSIDWSWFENVVTYCNGRIPQALFEACECVDDADFVNVALDSFNFLLKVQMKNGVFMPVGNNGWFKKGGKMAVYDQQSVEASCMSEAALVAFRVTGENDFKFLAKRIFEWYFGRNSKELLVYNPKIGGCYDGLTPKGLNLNQGAEATISYLLARLDFETWKNVFS
jgi:hypothetical protein